MEPSRRVHSWGGALPALAAAVGAVVGLRSVAVLDLPRFRNLLGLRGVPREAFGLDWSARALWPEQIQAQAMDRLTHLLVALLLLAAGVALLNTLVLLFEAGASRRREMAVRSALGATPSASLRSLLSDIRRLLVTGSALGLLLGLAWGGALRGAWPGVVDSPEWLGALAFLLPTLGVMVMLAAGAFAWTGLSISRGKNLARTLLSGERTTAAPGEAFQRRALASLQIGAAGAVTFAALALALGLDGPARLDGSEPATVTVVADVEAPGVPGASWLRLLKRLRAIPGLEAESLATPGALVGLGVRDHAMAQCGDCYRGGLPLPFWGAVADSHAVGPGFFALAGMELRAGRGFTWSDASGAPPVAVVNRTFADIAFENGDPVGRKVRLGADLDAWYEVVGVVEDQSILGVGGDDRARPAVYVSALQQVPRRGTLLLAGSDAAVATALRVATTLGFAPGDGKTLGQLRREARAPRGWLGGLGLILAMLTLGLAMHGGHATALQIVRRRERELAVRRALGATDGNIVRHVLAGAAGTALGGSVVAVLLGALLVALLRKVVGGVPALGPEAYLGVVAILVGTGLSASARAAREAVRVEPGLAME